MCKTQLFNDILHFVSEETEVPEVLILSNKYQAMWMLQCFLLQTKTET